jgi:V8-like Glu-specific endopeptidase
MRSSLRKNQWIGIMFILALVSGKVGVAAPFPHLEDSEEIVGGVKVLIEDPIEKSVVALYRVSGNSGTLCSATLIARDMALTAAHCVEDGTDGMMVIFGPNIRTDVGTAVRVLGSEVPRSWDAQSQEIKDLGDIAVIHFDGELPDGFVPVRLAPAKLALAAGDTVTLAGYGITRAGSETGAGVLRKAQVKIVDPDFGKTEMIFDQTSGVGACHGDSGGPAFFTRSGKTYLVGVTNRSYPNDAPDDCKQQVVYVKTAPYLKWIASSEKALRTP